MQATVIQPIVNSKTGEVLQIGQTVWITHIYPDKNGCEILTATDQVWGLSYKTMRESLAQN